MRIIELLSLQLDREALEHEIAASQRIFTEGLDFWGLCLEAKRLLLEEEETKRIKEKKPMGRPKKIREVSDATD